MIDINNLSTVNITYDLELEIPERDATVPRVLVAAWQFWCTCEHIIFVDTGENYVTPYYCHKHRYWIPQCE